MTSLGGRTLFASALGSCLLMAGIHFRGPQAGPPQPYIVQAAEASLAESAVSGLGARVEHELPIINAVRALLTREQADSLRASGAGFRVYEDNRATAASSFYSYSDEDKVKDIPYLDFPSHVGADLLHALGVDGENVTIAIIGSGVKSNANEFKKGKKDENRTLELYSAVKRKEGKGKDKFGHGSHIASIIANSSRSADGRFNNIAPGANLVVVQAFDKHGPGTYSDVIDGMNWIWQNREKFNIRVVNLSFSAAVNSRYWDDPLNQAVMRLWEAGIVVLASAGNNGPGAMSIGVPGYVPYVITVGAMTDDFTPADPSDDYLASFSAAGPTFEGFVKPEIVAPGGHITAFMDDKTEIAKDYPEYHNFDTYFTMSGTSEATTIVTGIAALMLQASPELEPDDVKCRLMAGARQAAYPDGRLAFSIFQQGAGLVDAVAAVNDTSTGCANRNLDIEADLAVTAHFGGPAAIDADGSFYIRGVDGHTWHPDEIEGSGYFWNDGFF